MHTPLTGAKVVDLIITDKAVFTVAKGGLILDELAPGVTVNEVIAFTDADILNIEDWEG